MSLFTDKEDNLKLAPIITVAASIILVIYLIAGCNRVTPTEVGFKINNAGGLPRS